MVIMLGAVLYFLFGVFHLRKAVIWLPLCIPLYLVRGELGGIPFTFVEALIYALVLAYFARLARGLFRTRKAGWGLFAGIRDFVAPRESLVHKYRYLLMGLGGVLLAALLSFIVTEKELVVLNGNLYPSLRIALGILKGWILAPMIYLLLILGTVRKTKDGLDIFNAYTISAVALSLWALYQVITQNFITPDMRVSGPFENANYLALYIGPALLYMIIRVRDALFPLASLEGKHRWSMPFIKGGVPVNFTMSSLFFVGTLILLFAFLATKSYGGILAVFAAGLLYFGLEYIQYWKKKGRTTFPWKVILISALILFVVLVSVFVLDPSKWQALFQFGQRNSSSVRIEVYTIAWGLLSDHWLLGIGMGQFQALYQLEAVNILGAAPYEWNMLHPHNFLLATWLNLGLLGLVSFIVILGICLHRAWDSFSIFATTKILSREKVRIIAFMMLVAIFVHGFFDTPFFKNDLALLFWLIVGVLFAVEKED